MVLAIRKKSAAQESQRGSWGRAWVVYVAPAMLPFNSRADGNSISHYHMQRWTRCSNRLSPVGDKGNVETIQHCSCDSEGTFQMMRTQSKSSKYPGMGREALQRREAATVQVELCVPSTWHGPWLPTCALVC
jgi:hypothetical protein